MNETLPEIKLELITETLAEMEKGSAKAVAALQQVTAIASEQEYEETNELLVRVRDAYNKIKDEKRMPITKRLDELKDRLMAPERPLSDDKNSEYTRVRNLLTAFRQQQIENKKKIEQEAAKKKERENNFVDTVAAIHTKLNDMVLAKTKKADTDSEAYFKKSTLEDFDKRAEAYRKMRPGLKPEDWSACFEVSRRFDLWTEAEWVDIITTLKKEEALAKWTDKIVEAATPVVNAWNAKIPDLKQNLINLKNAADETERKRIADAQEASAKEEAERRNKEMERVHVDQNQSISVQADLAKMNNEFAAQATVQQAADTGPVKYVLKFTDPKKTLPALTKIMYNCMIHPEFPGIQKKDKNKKLVVDDAGRPEYIDQVQWWINFFLSKCNVEIDGTAVYEVAKTIVRK